MAKICAKSYSKADKDAVCLAMFWRKYDFASELTDFKVAKR